MSCRTVKIAAAVSAALLLGACGDEITKVAGGAVGTGVVADLDEAGECDASALGRMVLNKSDSLLYVCDGEEWLSLKGAAGKAGASCSAKSVDEGIEITCGKKVDTLKTPELPDVDDGTSCEGRKIGSIGVEISCGGKPVDTLGSVKLCGGTAYDTKEAFCDERDGRIYRWARIGDQIWMAENLDFGEFATSVDACSGSAQPQDDATEEQADKYCYDDDEVNCRVPDNYPVRPPAVPPLSLGGFYQWHTAMALAEEFDRANASAAIQPVHRGICPEGWHVPTKAEWNKLAAFVDKANGGSAGDVGKSLKSALWVDADGDVFGFRALPAAVLLPGPGWTAVGESTGWWTADATDPGIAPIRAIFVETDSLRASDSLPRAMALSLRCVMDGETRGSNYDWETPPLPGAVFDYGVGNAGDGGMELSLSGENSARGRLDGVVGKAYRASIGLLQYAAAAEWGYVYGGLLYRFDEPADIGDTVVVQFRGETGRKLRFVALDKDEYESGEGEPKYTVDVTGEWQTVRFPASAIVPWTGATNSLDRGSVLAVALRYEEEAAQVGASCANCSTFPISLEWKAVAFK